MCGIAGYIGKGDLNLLKKMAETQSHRGPDDEGFSHGKNYGFAFRRMSVIDVMNGHQPIKSNCSDYICVVNGEIYNFKELRNELLELGHNFKSNSDSEVVLHGYEQWSNEVFRKLDGMFALAIWSSSKNKLILARDPFGKKPLHYLKNNNGFYFSSEVNPLKSVENKRLDLNKTSIFEYFQFDSVGDNLTIYEKIFKVRSGSYVVVDSDFNFEEYQYWYPKFRNKFFDVKESVEAINESLVRAVKKRLASDVPIGMFLSGGLDSSVIAAVLAKYSDKTFETFTFGFEDKSYDESVFAQKISNYLGLKNNLIKLKSLDAEKSIDLMADNLDEPLNDPAFIPQYLMSFEAKKQIDVVLTGDGGDELFFGYQHFLPNLILNKYKFSDLALKSAQFVLKNIRSRDQYFDIGFKSQRLARGLLVKDFWERDLSFRGAFDPKEINNYLELNYKNDSFNILLMKINSENLRINTQLSFYQKLNFIYSLTYLRDTVLVKVDRATMRHGLEARSPYMDIELFEYVNSISDKLRSKRIGEKYILKKVADLYLPRELTQNRKHGFGVPVSKWLKNDLKKQLLHYTSAKFLNKQGIFISKNVESLVQKHLSGLYDYRKELWGILLFQRWYEKNGY